MLITLLLIFLALTALGLIAGCLFLARRVRPAVRQHFTGGAFCAVLALLFTVIGLGWEIWHGIYDEPTGKFYNFLPFVWFMNIFFIPAGILAALMGIYHDRYGTSPYK